MVELATELASIWASTVDHSGNTMCWKPVCGEYASRVLSVSENAHVSCPGNTL